MPSPPDAYARPTHEAALRAASSFCQHRWRWHEASRTTRQWSWKCRRWWASTGVCWPVWLPGQPQVPRAPVRCPIRGLTYSRLCVAGSHTCNRQERRHGGRLQAARWQHAALEHSHTRIQPSMDRWVHGGRVPRFVREAIFERVWVLHASRPGRHVVVVGARARGDL